MSKTKIMTSAKRSKPYLITYLVAVAIPLLVGLLSTLVTKGNMAIYTEMQKPPLAPAPWVFPVVWTLLYTLMGISSATAVINRKDDNTKSLKSALEFYTLSLILNFGWSIIFFNMEAYFSALVWLAILVWTVVKTVAYYFKVSRSAALLQLPYLLWLAFAFYLNAFYAFLM